ncbi:MAG: hypothetical protein H6667_11840 [Ardenticatenaceae bacterium]|nr:hypothetical protein [Ardenticatenaceae bacterium]
MMGAPPVCESGLRTMREEEAFGEELARPFRQSRGAASTARAGVTQNGM